jgi:hypothetical protein
MPAQEDSDLRGLTYSHITFDNSILSDVVIGRSKISSKATKQATWAVLVVDQDRIEKRHKTFSYQPRS